MMMIPILPIGALICIWQRRPLRYFGVVGFVGGGYLKIDEQILNHID
jgi:hypothetical protein